MRALVTGAFDPAGRLVIEQLLEREIEGVAADVANEAEFPGVLALREIPAADDPLLVNVLRSLVEEFQATLLVPTRAEEVAQVAAGISGAG